jgi:hypothetical protein
MRKTSLKVLLLIVVFAAGFSLLLGESDNSARHAHSPDASARSGGTPKKASSSEPLVAQRPPFFARALNQPKIETEVMFSSNMRATYEKYKLADDPTGEISYFLSKGLDDCTPFVGRTPEQISASMNARREVIDSPQRTALIRDFIDRCKGFSEWGRATLIAHVDELKQRAVAAGYPAAVAQTLTTTLWREGMQKADTVAMSLLSGSVDGDVVLGLYQYLLARNGNEWFEEQGDPAAAFNAWFLLACNMGADCGDRSRMVIAGCLYYGACDQHEVIAVLPIMNPALDPRRLQEAIAIEAALGNAIENRDWVRLGFTYLRKRPDSASK